jgi:hypothetical protein
MVLLNLIRTVPNLIILTVCFKLHDIHVLSYIPFENLRDSFRLFPKLHILKFQYEKWQVHTYVCPLHVKISI